MPPFLDAFLDHMLHLKNYSEHTLVAYKKDILQFTVFSNIRSEQDVLVITNKHVRAWLVSLHTDGLAPSTINRKISAVKSYFKFLLAQGIVKSNPANTVGKVKSPKRLASFVPSGHLIEENENGMALRFSDDLSPQEHAIILLLYITGIRRNELISLKKEDLDFKAQKIVVMGKRSKERSVALLNASIPALQAYCNSVCFLPSSIYFFHKKNGEKLDPKFVYNVVNKYIHKCSNVTKASPHVLRHSFATHLLDNGADINGIKELLGHSSLAATQVYTHNSIKALKETIKKAHPRGG